MNRNLFYILGYLYKLWDTNPELREKILEALNKGGKFLENFYKQIKEKLSE